MIHATPNSDLSAREERNLARSRRIAAEGMVLLENHGALPMQLSGRKIALFGNGARHTVKGGTGSGDVNSRFVVTVEEGLEQCGAAITTKPWLNRFDALCQKAQADYQAWLNDAVAQSNMPAVLVMFAHPYHAPLTTEITEEDLAHSDTDTAIYVLSRNSGEGADRKAESGDFMLSAEEKTALETLQQRFAQVIVILNVGGVIDTAFLRAQSGISAILLMSQAGAMGGLALADVLCGAATPSGHLATTWAERYDDYPSATQYSYLNGDLDDEYYREGIYVGYRWFDTFGISPAYPFGYGLSYTSFQMDALCVKADEERVSLRLSVANTGKLPGRAVPQLYVSAPQGRLEKPWQELKAFAKTRLLAPGETEELTLSFPLASLASYDEQSSAYMLEKGEYFLRLGEHSRATHVVAALSLDADAVTEQLTHLFPLDCDMQEISNADAIPYTYPEEAAEKAAAPRLPLRADSIPCKKVSYSAPNAALPRDLSAPTWTMDDVRAGRCTMEALVSQLTMREMAELCVGTAREAEAQSALGIASTTCPGAAGDTSSVLSATRNVHNMVLADGPAGLRLTRTFRVDEQGVIHPDGDTLLDATLGLTSTQKGGTAYHQYCTAIPIATLLAQTWDVDAIREAGDIVGEEMEELGVTLWLAPGMNIHRNPLCGRNFEYYSEDPLMAGLCAAADTLGVQAHRGVGTTIKHFACNNQEDNRMHTCAHVSERALREIYLKGFEIAVKAAQPMSIMTSYNLINGIHAANHLDLLTRAARDEWGFAGCIMTDWGTTGQYEGENDGLKYGSSLAAGCIKAGNDLVMPGSARDLNAIVAAVDAQNGAVPCPITLGDLQACACRILKVVAQSSACENAAPYANHHGLGLNAFVRVDR